MILRKIYEWRVGCTTFTKWANGKVTAVSKSNSQQRNEEILDKLD